MRPCVRTKWRPSQHATRPPSGHAGAAALWRMAAVAQYFNRDARPRRSSRNAGNRRSRGRSHCEFARRDARPAIVEGGD
jgi:hypothetical protein